MDRTELFAAIGVCALFGIGSACGPSETTSCPEGEIYDEASETCISAIGVDSGTNPDADGSDTAGDAGADTSGSRDPTGEQQPSEPSCEDWTDPDGDGHLCHYDNCPTTSNPDQTDSDGDAIGDACDNCPKTANAAQRDSNGDGRGDACTGSAGYSWTRDHDGDGQQTTKDNCPRTPNPNQTDSDGDGIGDKCDNCPQAANYDQTDSDGDGTGDACTRKPVGKTCDSLTKTSEIKQTDLYVILDKSGSMGGGKMGQAKDALDKVASVVGGTSMQFGLYAYDTVSCREFLPMGTHTTSTIENSYQSIRPGGNTPTGPAMEKVRTQGLFRPTGGGTGNNAVIVITDGNANTCSCSGGTFCNPERYAIAEARAFHDRANTDVYVVGYQFNGDTNVLNRMASAGGTGNYYPAKDPSSLTKTLLGVALAGCKVELDDSSKGKIDPAKLWVKINNKWVKPEHVSYDKSSHSVTIDPAVCSSQSGRRTVKVVAGCPTDCDNPTEEVCDYEDNDCDGTIDEGCRGCTAEVCDGEDNDCDGIIDEGCCPGAILGESCSKDADCCRGRCLDGTCREPCRPAGTVCSEDSQCCGERNVCGKTGGSERGQCIGG